MMHYFCTVCDAALTVSSRDEENHYWQAVMAYCEMEIKPLVITAPTLSLAHTDTQASTARQQWLQTNEQITSPSSPSLADWTQIVMRDMHREQNHFECLQILLPLKLKALVEQLGKASLWNLFEKWTPQISSLERHEQYVVVCRVKLPNTIKRKRYASHCHLTNDPALYLITCQLAVTLCRF